MAHPQQPGPVLVDLIKEGPEHSADPNADFVHPDDSNVLQHPVFKPVINHPLDRAVNVGPGHLEAHGHFLPAKLACPVGQKDPEAIAQAILACGPGDFSTTTPQSAQSTRRMVYMRIIANLKTGGMSQVRGRSA